MSPRLGDHSMTLRTLRHSCSLLPHGKLQFGLLMWLHGWETAGRHTVLTLEIRSSRKAWRSHVLEAKQFLLDRGLKTHSLLMPFLPWRKNAFPEFCVLRFTHCLKALLWGHFSVPISPEAVTLGSGHTLTVKSKPTSKHLFHQVFSVGEIREAYMSL